MVLCYLLFSGGIFPRLSQAENQVRPVNQEQRGDGNPPLGCCVEFNVGKACCCGMSAAMSAALRCLRCLRSFAACALLGLRRIFFAAVVAALRAFSPRFGGGFAMRRACSFGSFAMAGLSFCGCYENQVFKVSDSVTKFMAVTALKKPHDVRLYNEECCLLGSNVL